MLQKNQPTRLRSQAHDIRRTLRLIWRVTPFWTSSSLCLVVVQGFLPLAALYLLKKVIDTVTVSVKAGAAGPDAVRNLILYIALAGGVAILVALFRILAEIVAEAQSFHVTEEMSDLIHQQSIRLDLAHFENPACRDMMHRAQEEAPHRPLAILNSITQMGQAGVSLVGIAGLLISYNIALTFILLLCALPGALIRLYFSRRMRDIGRRQTQDKRLAQFLHAYLIYEYPAKEMKLFQLGDLFRARYRDLQKRLRLGRLGAFRQRECADFLGQCIAAIALFASLGYVALSALRGAISLGAMVMYYQAFQTGLSQLQSFLRAAAGLLEHRLFLENFYQFLDLRSTITAEEPGMQSGVPGLESEENERRNTRTPREEGRGDRGQGTGNREQGRENARDTEENAISDGPRKTRNTQTPDHSLLPLNRATDLAEISTQRPIVDHIEHKELKEKPAPHTIRFENVSFRYPGRAEWALQDINIEIKPGQVVALVGPNGSGKTTIAKLIPRLYDPTSGRITVDGIDIRQFDPAEWRRQVSVVFQDFLRYPISARDNIWFGDIQRAPNPERIREAAVSSGADSLIGRFARGYDTVLGNEYNGGHQLSGGEWQKIAIARAFFREAPLAILDEPSSALDPRAEAELFSRFRSLIAGRSAILISHRFSTVQMADYIYVLDEGHITEQGTHPDLLALGSTYAQLYYLQAEKFLEAEAE